MKQIAWLVLCVALASANSMARAEDGPAAALHQRLDVLDDEERALLAPLMERGPIALVELAQADELPSVLVAGYVEAPAALAAQVIARPQDYPKFMHTLDHVEVLSQSPTQIAYNWTWQTGVLFLEGENRMTVLAPPKDHPELGHRISVKSERGHLGEGRLMWRVIPAGEKRSLVMLAMRVDMREANFVMRQLDSAARSVNRSVNLALCYVMMLGTKRETEKRAGYAPKLAQTVPFEPPQLDLPKLQKVLSRGDLLLMELTPSGLGKLSIAGRTGMQPSALKPIMTEPETFGKSLVPGSYTRVTKREGTSKTFEWGINLPLIGTSGVMNMHESADTLAIEAVEGALKGGQWRYSTPTLPGGEAVVVGYSRFDITKSTWLIEKIAALDPAMGHGLAAATQVMMLRALRKRAHEEAKLAKAAAKHASAAKAALPAPAAGPAAPAQPAAPKAGPTATAPVPSSAVEASPTPASAPTPEPAPASTAAPSKTPPPADAPTPPAAPAPSAPPASSKPSAPKGAGPAVHAH